MSIIAYTGLPGAYKTYSAVENWLIPALKDDRTVAHNLRVNEAACMAASGGHARGLVHTQVMSCLLYTSPSPRD